MKFCQLIASLSVYLLFYLNFTWQNSNLSTSSSAFSSKKKDFGTNSNTDKNVFVSLEFDFQPKQTESGIGLKDQAVSTQVNWFEASFENWTRIKFIVRY